MNKVSQISIPPAIQGLLPAFFCLLSGLTDRLYTDIDTFYISMTCAGLYGKGSICPVIHPFLSIFIGTLSSLCSTVDWFALFCHVFTTLAFWWLGTIFAYCIPWLSTKLTCYFLIGLFFLQTSLFSANFTILCGLFACLGTITLLLVLRDALPRRACLLSALFFCVGILLRLEGAALFIPFILLDLFALLFQHQLTFRKTILTLCSCLLVPLLLAGSVSIFRLVSPAQADAAAFNALRSTLNDYPSASWDTIQAQMDATGISQNDYTMLTTAMVADTALVNSDILQKVADASRQLSQPASVKTTLQFLRELPGIFFSSLSHLLIGFSALLLTAIFLSLSTLLSKIEAVLSVCGLCVICVYYCYIGRLPDRVALCLLLALLSILVVLFLSSPARTQSLVRWSWRVSAIALGGLLCLGLWKNRYSYRINQSCLTARQDDAVSAPLQETDTDDSVYLWSSMDLALYVTGEYVQDGKLPGTAFVHRNLAWGEWNTSGQPFYQHMLDEIQLSNPMQSLLTRPHTYLVSEDSSLIETWLQEHYDPSATLQQVGTVDVFALGPVPIWQAVTN